MPGDVDTPPVERERAHAALARAEGREPLHALPSMVVVARLTITPFVRT
jgi:hypothetical protein